MVAQTARQKWLGGHRVQRIQLHTGETGFHILGIHNIVFTVQATTS